MTNKLNFFAKRVVAENLHKRFIQLINVEFDESAKEPTIGYRVKNQRYKFATLHGSRSYQSLILHVNPGKRNTAIGKELQKEIQNKLDFNISEIRNHVLKPNEVFIPLEILLESNPLSGLKHLVYYAYYVKDNT